VNDHPPNGRFLPGFAGKSEQRGDKAHQGEECHASETIALSGSTGKR
jgi:hypothetical protein